MKYRHDRPRGRRSEQGGQTLVEFAVVLPIFLLIIFGLFDVGRMVFSNASISQAAREGARLAAAEVSWIGASSAACVADESLITSANPGAHVCPVNTAEFKSHVSDAVGRMTVLLGSINDVHLSCNAGTESDPSPSGDWTESSGGNGCSDDDGEPLASPGDQVSVRIEYTYQFFAPIVSSFLGPVPLSASASMTVN